MLRYSHIACLLFVVGYVHAQTAGVTAAAAGTTVLPAGTTTPPAAATAAAVGTTALPVGAATSSAPLGTTGLAYLSQVAVTGQEYNTSACATTDVNSAVVNFNSTLGSCWFYENKTVSGTTYQFWAKAWLTSGWLWIQLFNDSICNVSVSSNTQFGNGVCGNITTSVTAVNILFVKYTWTAPVSSTTAAAAAGTTAVAAAAATAAAAGTTAVAAAAGTTAAAAAVGTTGIRYLITTVTAQQYNNSVCTVTTGTAQTITSTLGSCVQYPTALSTGFTPFHITWVSATTLSIQLFTAAGCGASTSVTSVTSFTNGVCGSLSYIVPSVTNGTVYLKFTWSASTGSVSSVATTGCIAGNCPSTASSLAVTIVPFLLAIVAAVVLF